MLRDTTREPIIDFNHVGVKLQGKQILQDITFSVLPGSFIGIIGPNGAGKTTLLRLILGLLAPDQGQVRVLGQSPERLTRASRKIGYLPQKSRFDNRFPVTVKDVVLMGSIRDVGPWRLPGLKEKAAALNIMDRLGLQKLANYPIGELSGGQQQLAFLAAALISQPKLLVLDEPTNGLDPAAQNNFYRLVKQMQGEMSLTVLTVSHDLAAISANSDRLICINKTMHMHGSPREVIDRLAQNQIYRCEFDLLFGSYGWRGRP